MVAYPCPRSQRTKIYAPLCLVRVEIILQLLSNIEDGRMDAMFEQISFEKLRNLG